MRAPRNRAYPVASTFLPAPVSAAIRAPAFWKRRACRQVPLRAHADRARVLRAESFREFVRSRVNVCRPFFAPHLDEVCESCAGPGELHPAVRGHANGTNSAQCMQSRAADRICEGLAYLIQTSFV